MYSSLPIRCAVYPLFCSVVATSEQSSYEAEAGMKTYAFSSVPFFVLFPQIA